MAQTNAERISELESEIAEITTALSNMRKAGQKFQISTGSGGGTMRQTEMVSYNELVRHREELQSELDSLNRVRSSRVRPNW